MNPLPKIAPLRGSLHLEWKRCGRATCRCRDGNLHGPYYARHWWERGRQRKAYVRARDVVATLLAIEAHREAFPPVARMMALVESAQRATMKEGAR
jgi:hypothetical protein